MNRRVYMARQSHLFIGRGKLDRQSVISKPLRVPTSPFFLFMTIVTSASWCPLSATPLISFKTIYSCNSYSFLLVSHFALLFSRQLLNVSCLPKSWPNKEISLCCFGCRERANMDGLEKSRLFASGRGVQSSPVQSSPSSRVAMKAQNE